MAQCIHPSPWILTVKIHHSVKKGPLMLPEIYHRVKKIQKSNLTLPAGAEFDSRRVLGFGAQLS
jgi:hypothetical protein